MTNKAVTSKTDKPSHYERLAEIFRIAKYAALICMVIYLLLSVAVYRNELTVENFRYLMKYFDSSSAEYTDGMLKNYNDIYLDATSDIMLGLFTTTLPWSRTIPSISTTCWATTPSAIPSPTRRRCF